MKRISITEARGLLSSFVDQASIGERFEITRRGRSVAVLLGASEHDAMLETAAVLSDTEQVREISLGLRDLERGGAATPGSVRDGRRTT